MSGYSIETESLSATAWHVRRGGALALAVMLMLALAPVAVFAQDTDRQRIEALEKSVRESGENIKQIAAIMKVFEERLRQLEQGLQDATVTLNNIKAGTVGNSGAGEAPASRLSAERDQALTWTRDDTLFDPPPKDGDTGSVPTVADAAVGDGFTSGGASTTTTPTPTPTITPPGNATANNAAAPPVTGNTATAAVTIPPIISRGATLRQAVPAPSVEEIETQYLNAINKALAHDLDGAETEFETFISRYPGHERMPDVFFWLGRTQFRNGKYDRAAKTFSDFQTRWPDDPRREETTLLLGRSVVQFIPPAEICGFLERLPPLVPDPGDAFVKGFEKLRADANCTS